MRFGYWLPVFGGWLRNVADEGMAAPWDYVARLARRSEELGFDLTLDRRAQPQRHQGPRRARRSTPGPRPRRWPPSPTASRSWSPSGPTFHAPALLAKQAANIDHISNGRLSLNVVSSWWAARRQYGVPFDQHDERYARTAEWLEVVDGLWRAPASRYPGRYYTVDDTMLEPKPVAEAAPDRSTRAASRRRRRR